MKQLSDYVQLNMKVLRKRLRGIVVNQTDVDDIIQEACVAILNAKPVLTDAEFPKYFTRVLFTKVAAYKNGADGATILAGFVSKEECPNEGPEGLLMEQQDMERIPALIEKHVAPDALQEALYLMYCEGCQPQVAADLVGIKRSYLDVGNARFKKLIDGVAL